VHGFTVFVVVCIGASHPAISHGQQQGTVEAPEGGNCPITYMLFSKPIML
jgi:hypothetical protein